MRMDETDGPPAALNPSGRGSGGNTPIFSRPEVSQLRLVFCSFHDLDDGTARSPPSTSRAGTRAKGGRPVRRRGRSPLPHSASTGGMGQYTPFTSAINVTVVDDQADKEPAASSAAHPPPTEITSTCVASPQPVEFVPPHGPLGLVAVSGDWDALSKVLAARARSTFLTGGPGVGKSSSLRTLRTVLSNKWPGAEEVVSVAPMESSAMTAGGQTYHSFFGFPRAYKPESADPDLEATRMMSLRRFSPIARRPAAVRALLIDEVSMVEADRLEVMVELLRQ